MFQDLIDKQKNIVHKNCKSEFCIICENFMGFVDSKPMCRVYDTIPCDYFVYNGCPKPDAPKGCKPTELTNEYLLNLVKKSNRQNG